MNKFWLVLRKGTSRVSEAQRDPEPRVYYVTVHDTEPALEFKSLHEAKMFAAERAGQTGQPHLVVEVLGQEMPVYDPQVGWEAAK